MKLIPPLTQGQPPSHPIYVNLKVKSLDGKEVYFNVMRSHGLRRVMIVACARLSLEINDIHFMFEGRSVLPEQTPDELNMRDGDVIDAFPSQQQQTEDGTHQDDSIQSTNPTPLINIKVKALDGTRVYFRIKGRTQLRKLMIAYCERRSMEVTAFTFWFNACRLRSEQTPDELGMKDGDEIGAMPCQFPVVQV